MKFTHYPEIKIGDHVRIYKKRLKGEKENVPKWSRNSFEVLRIEHHPIAGNIYYLSGNGNKPFLRAHILKVNTNLEVGGKIKILKNNKHITTLNDLIETRKEQPYDDYQYNFKKYPAPQLKNILRLELRNNGCKDNITKFKKQEVITALRGLKYALEEPVEEIVRTSNLLKKYSTKKYSETEQE